MRCYLITLAAALTAQVLVLIALGWAALSAISHAPWWARLEARFFGEEGE